MIYPAIALTGGSLQAITEGFTTNFQGKKIYKRDYKRLSILAEHTSRNNKELSIILDKDLYKCIQSMELGKYYFWLCGLVPSKVGLSLIYLNHSESIERLKLKLDHWVLKFSNYEDILISRSIENQNNHDLAISDYLEALDIIKDIEGINDNNDSFIIPPF